VIPDSLEAAAGPVCAPLSMAQEQKRTGQLMQQTLLISDESPSILGETYQSGAGAGVDDFGQMAEPLVQTVASVPEEVSREITCQDGGESEEGLANPDLAVADPCVDVADPDLVLEDPDRTLDFDLAAWAASIARGNARYQSGDPDCEADYRAAFFLDAPLTASKFVRGLNDEVRANVTHVLLTCRGRLRINPRDVVARTRLGLTLFLLCQEEEAFRELHQVFLQSPVWRPFLRLLVNEAKPRRPRLFARILRSP
jgi:hypothetical protein